MVVQRMRAGRQRPYHLVDLGDVDVVADQDQLRHQVSGMRAEDGLGDPCGEGRGVGAQAARRCTSIDSTAQQVAAS